MERTKFKLRQGGIKHLARSFRTADWGSHPIPCIKKEDFRLLFKSGGQGWIRTTVVSRRQIYSLLPLATRAPTLIIFSIRVKSALDEI